MSPSPTPPSPPTIELADVSVRFGDVVVLDGVDLTIPPGARLGVIGPAAAGKSLLLKLICGLVGDEATIGGAVSIGGEAVTGRREEDLMPLRQRIGMLFQNYALFDSMTVAENVGFPLVRQGGHAPDAIAARVAERLRAVGLGDRGDRLPSELSGGMKKRVGIARATVARPSIALYDEPTAGLDPVTTAKIYDLLRADQAATGGTVVAVSSDVAALLAFADTIAMIDGGRLRYCGPAAGVEGAADPRVRRFVSGEASETDEDAA